jgi:hypothetical protein
MDWLKIYGSLTSNMKLARAARKAGVGRPQMVGHLCFLWHWAAVNAPTGDLSGIGASDLANAAGWEGSPQLFVQALLTAGIRKGQAGFLEDNGDGGLKLHDWDQYTGADIKRMKAEAQRVQAWRQRRRDESALLDQAQPEPDAPPATSEPVGVTDADSPSTLIVTENTWVILPH